MNDQTNLNADQSNEAVPAVAAPKLTRAEKNAKRAEFLAKRIQDDTAEYNELANEINNAAALASLAIGSVVVIKLGRKFADKDTTRSQEATIIGERTEEDGGKQYKVTYGAGFDAAIAVVSAGQILSVGPLTA